MQYISINEQDERVELWYNPNIRSWCIIVRYVVDPGKSWYQFYVLGGLTLPTDTPIKPRLDAELIRAYNALVAQYVYHS